MHFAKYTAKTSFNMVTVFLILVIFKYTYKFQFIELKQVQTLIENAPVTLKFAPIIKWYQNFRLLTNKNELLSTKRKFVFSCFWALLSQNCAKSRKNTRNHTLQRSSGLPQRYFYARSGAKKDITFCRSLLK